MNYLEFKNQMFDLACFNINQVYAWQPDFDRNNLTRWLKKSLLIHLRQGYYSFPDYKDKVDFAYYFANRIYRPSYISLHTALSHYGIIPEAVVQITSVTTLKTAAFTNEFGDYSYKSVKEDLYFGFNLKQISDDKTLLLATPEKAVLDLLYLYPFYDTEQELLALRLDEEFIYNELNINLLKEFCAHFKNKSLEKRVQLLMKSYKI